MKINPPRTQRLLDEMKAQEDEMIDVDGVKILTAKNVFPPKHVFSETFWESHGIFGDLRNKVILDVGTGTGIQAIKAVSGGAERAVGVDINPEAIECARENVRLNGFQDKIDIKKSDLFCGLDLSEKYDLIIANLPIVDFPATGVAESALYDHDYNLRKRFLNEAKNFLKNDGAIIIMHVNFTGENDFNNFEQIISDSGYLIEAHVETSEDGYLWRMYRIKPLVK